MSIFENASDVSAPHSSFNIIGDQTHNHYVNHDAGPDYRPHVIANWLSSLDFRESQADFLEKRTEGTGEWLLESRQFQHWLTGESRILWCSGIPGAGKTFLAAIAVDHLQKLFKDEDVAIACIFCNYKEQSTQSLEELVASILKQIIQDQPLVSDSIKAFCRDFRDKQRRPRFTNLKDALRSEIRTYSKVFFVVDALDECLEDNQGSLITELKSLASTVHLMVTSRPLDLIKQRFQGACYLDINAKEEDVRKYTEARVRRGQTKNEILLSQLVQENHGLQDDIVDKLATNTRGMFLMAKLHMDSLVSRRSAWEVRNALNSLPTEVNATYDEAMKRIQRQSETDRILANRILSWITHARKPLSYQELQYALAVTPQMTDIITEALVDKHFLIDICAGLVVIDEQSTIIRLVHYTTQEYFSAKRESLFPDGQVDIALTCLRYLSLDKFGVDHYNRQRSEPSWTTLLHRSPLLEYAAAHWGHHAHGNREETCKEVVINFLQKESNVACAVNVLLGDRWPYTPFHDRLSTSEAAGMHLLAFFGLERSVHDQLDKGGNADPRGIAGRTPLSWAAENGHTGVVNILLARHDVDVNSVDSYGRTPLSWGAANGHTDVVTILVARVDIDVDPRDWYGRTPLSRASENGHMRVVNILLTRQDVDVNSKDETGHMPLSRAVENGHMEIVSILVAREDTDVNLKSRNGRTMLSRAAENGDTGLVRILVAREDVDVNSKDTMGCTPLSWAAIKGHTDVVSILAAREDVDVNSKDVNGQTPLSRAAENGHADVVSIFVARADVDVNLKDVNGRTPLSRAAENGHTRVVNTLLAREDIDTDSILDPDPHWSPPYHSRSKRKRISYRNNDHD